MMSLYDVLKISTKATEAEIEKSYRLLVRSCYVTSNRINADDFIKINSAYTILRDKHRRKFYDMFGATSIQLLLNNRESYILTRMFDKLNVYIYLCAFTISIITILTLPFLIASNVVMAYTLMVSPLGIAGVLFVIPIFKSLFMLYYAYGVSQELKSIIFVTCEILLTIFHICNCTLYFDKVVEAIFIPIIVSFVLECLSLINFFYYQTMPERLMTVNRKNIFIGRLIKFLVFTSIVLPIPSFIKPFMLVLQMAWAFLDIRYNITIYVAVLIPFILYSVTFSFILAKVRSFFIYVPLIILIVLIIVNISQGLSTIINNIPKSRYNVKALPLYCKPDINPYLK